MIFSSSPDAGHAASPRLRERPRLRADCRRSRPRPINLRADVPARALARTFVTNNNAGEKVADISGLAGIYSGSMLAEYWRPHCCDVWGRGFRAGNSAVIAQAGANLFKEFSPDLKHLLKRK